MYAVNRLWFLVGRWQWGSRVGFRGDGEAVEADRRLEDKDSSK